MAQKINLTAIIVAVLIIVGLFAIFYLYQSGQNKSTVSATGNFETKVSPDEAIVYLLIQTKGSSAEQVKNENAKISDDVLTALIKVGVERKDIETENYNIQPEYNWTSGDQKIIGYTASNNMKITTKDFNNVGKIIDASVDSGALVSYINFELSTEKNNEYKALVMANASLDAKHKAESIAAGLGKTVGRIVSVSASDFYYRPYPLYTAEAGQDVKAVATNIQPKSLDVSATVTVTCEIS